MQPRREGDQRAEVAVVCGLKCINVFGSVVAGHDDGQVVVLDEVPGDQCSRHSAVAVGEGMDLGEPVVEPRGDQQGVVGVGPFDVFAVLREQVVEFGVDVFRRTVLMDDAVGTGGVVGQGLEGAGVQASVKGFPLRGERPVGGLVGDDNLVELPDGCPADGVSAADFTVDGVEGRHVVLQDGQQVVRILASAAWWNGRGFEALFNEGPGLGFVQPVEAFKDAGLDGPAAVQRRQAGVSDL